MYGRPGGPVPLLSFVPLEDLKLFHVKAMAPYLIRFQLHGRHIDLCVDRRAWFAGFHSLFSLLSEEVDQTHLINLVFKQNHSKIFTNYSEQVNEVRLINLDALKEWFFGFQDLFWSIILNNFSPKMWHVLKPFGTFGVGMAPSRGQTSWVAEKKLVQKKYFCTNYFRWGHRIVFVCVFILSLHTDVLLSCKTSYIQHLI